MAYTTINKSTDYFNTVLYTGDGSSSDRTITGVGFQPDWLWNKSRSNAYNHYIFDVVRGTNMLSSNATTADEDKSPQFSTFTSDGFTIRNDAGSLAINASGVTFANWCWKAGGSGSANTDGSINTTSTSVNTTAGFSISKYTGTGSNATVGHGLGSAPKMVIIKSLSAVGDWLVGHSGIGFTERILLNTTAAKVTDSTSWQNTAPTSSVFSIGTNGACNTSSTTYIAYCFAEKQGFSKFGKYTGNGNADGAFIYTGFKPAFFMWKRSSSSGGWYISDAKRDTFNEVDVVLSANDNGTESDQGTTFDHDFVSNGIKIRNSVAAANSSGETFIYMAFAEAPLVGSNNVPATAR